MKKSRIIDRILYLESRLNWCRNTEQFIKLEKEILKLKESIND